MGWTVVLVEAIETGEDVRGASLMMRGRLTLEVRGGGCETEDETDTWPMELTTSSRPWKLTLAAEWTEPMRWRFATKRSGGDLSRVDRSSSVRVRGRMPAPALMNSASLELARAMKLRGFVREDWLPERGDMGGEAPA